MIAKNVTRDQRQATLKVVNKKYENNIVFHPECDLLAVGRRLRFRLWTRNCRDKGARLHKSPVGTRRGRSACWHVHGDFFDALFEIEPTAIIRSMDKIITKSEGNWIDRNIGSIVYPAYYSKSCECGDEV